MPLSSYSIMAWYLHIEWLHWKIPNMFWKRTITMTSQWAGCRLKSPTFVYSTVNSGADQRKHQSSASLAFVRGIHRWPMNFPHKGPVTRKKFPFDDVIMESNVSQPCMNIGWTVSVGACGCTVQHALPVSLHSISNCIILAQMSCKFKIRGWLTQPLDTESRPQDDVIKWKHFPRYWPFVRGIHRSPVNSPYKGQWRGALILRFMCVWINNWVNNHKAGDLRRYRAHYDVSVMKHQ